jgi:hypothetical protein
MSHLLCSSSNVDFETVFLQSIAKVSRNETMVDRSEQSTTNSAVIQILNLLMGMDAAAFFLLDLATKRFKPMVLNIEGLTQMEAKAGRRRIFIHGQTSDRLNHLVRLKRAWQSLLAGTPQIPGKISPLLASSGKNCVQIRPSQVPSPMPIM